MLNNITDCLDKASTALEKGQFVINELTNRYDFTNVPTSIICQNLNIEAKTWLWEYKRIMVQLYIAQDYVCEASKLLVQMQEINRINRRGGVIHA